MKRIDSVGIIGAGQMGSGIAQITAEAGQAVIVYDQNPTAMERARTRITTALDKKVHKNALPADARDVVMQRITWAESLQSMQKADLVIEAITENMTTKQTILQSLLPHVQESAILASNTSSLSITRLAAATAHPENFIGIHFMNPVPVMKLVEVIKGLATSEQTYRMCYDWVVGLGKIIAVAQDYPGFLVNRVLLPMINEAVYALLEGIGDVRAIDTALQRGANHPMGPLALADLIGLDTCLAVMQVLHSELGDSKYRPCPLLIKYVEAGWLGRKSGCGFYNYSDEGAPVPNAPMRAFVK